jgi:rhodanese-related sulfurtransferase
MFNTIIEKLGIDSHALSIPKITPQQAHQEVSSGNLVLIDVREPNEWADTGCAENASRIALQNHNFVEEVLHLVNNDKNASIAVSCKSGMRGDQAVKRLKAANFTNVVNVEGGILKWISEQLPVN